MGHHYRIVMNPGDALVDVFPLPGRDDTRIEEVYTRIGMMVMSERIAQITVYRDGQVYRVWAPEKEQGS